MRKLLSSLAVFAVATISAHAITYTDTDVFAAFLTQGQSYSGTFNIANKGFDPSTETVTSAEAWFLVSDDIDPLRSEWVKFTIGALDSYGPFEVDFLSVFGGSISGTALFDLNTDGILSYKITSTSGDFWAFGADLHAHAEAKNVPDAGTTAALLGVSVIGVALLTRRFGFAAR
jgi:hypothetical protein